MTVTRGEVGGYNVRGLWNIYKGHMYKNQGEVEVGEGGRDGWVGGKC